MDSRSVDQLARVLAATKSRRVALRQMAGVLAGLAIAHPIAESAMALPAKGNAPAPRACDTVCDNPKSPVSARERCGCATICTPTGGFAFCARDVEGNTYSFCSSGAFGFCDSNDDCPSSQCGERTDCTTACVNGSNGAGAIDPPLCFVMFTACD